MLCILLPSPLRCNHQPSPPALVFSHPKLSQLHRSPSHLKEQQDSPRPRPGRPALTCQCPRSRAPGRQALRGLRARSSTPWTVGYLKIWAPPPPRALPIFCPGCVRRSGVTQKFLFFPLEQGRQCMQSPSRASCVQALGMPRETRPPHLKAHHCPRRPDVHTDKPHLL